MYQHGRVVSIFLSVLCIFGCASLTGCFSALPIGELDPGDADGNGQIDIWDVRSIQRSADTRHLHVARPSIADVSQNGFVDAGDAEAVEKHIHGLSTIVITVEEPEPDLDAIIDEDVEPEPLIHHVGDTVVIRAIDTFLPKDVLTGTVRIQSAAADYDSGELPLERHIDGRSFYLRWRTAGLKSAQDYRLSVTLQKRTPPAAPAIPNDRNVLSSITLVSHTLPNVASQSEPVEPTEAFKQSLEIALNARDCEVMLLDCETDVSLPFWTLGLHLTRRYFHDPYVEAEETALGYGWTHAYQVRLREDTDGSISVLGTGVELGSFRRLTEGRYDPPAGLHARLTRDPDGSFRLLLGSGEYWQFGSDLLAREIVSAEGQHVQLVRDDNDDLMLVEDASGQQLEFQYDDIGRLVGLRDSTGRTITYKYDDAGDLTTVVAADGQRTTYTYDEFHRLLETRHSASWQRYTYDEQGRVTNRRTSAGSVAELTYARSASGGTVRTISDERGCLETQSLNCNGLVQSTEPRAGINLHIERDAEQRVTAIKHASESWKREHDEFNRTLKLVSPDQTLKTAYRDAGGGPISMLDGNGMETRLRYLDSGRPTHIQFPDGTVETRYYSKTNNGNSLKRVLRNGQIVHYQFDARGLLLEKRLPDKSRWTYSYDNLGNLRTARNPWGQLSFQYAGNRLMAVTYPNERRFAYGYDEAGNVNKITNPDGQSLSLVYSSAGRLISLNGPRGELLATYTEDPAGQLIERQVGVVSTKYEYLDGRLHKLVHQAGGKTSERRFAAKGNEVCVSTSAGQAACEYNAAQQLISAKYADGSKEAFSYDNAGNRLTHTHDSATTEYAANVLNQYTAINKGTRQYDLNGNLNSENVAEGRVTYEHDAENRLVRVRLPGNRTIQYVYDPLGRLAKRLEGGEEQNFLWDRDRLAQVEDQAHHVLLRLVWGRESDELVAMARATEWQFALLDEQHSVEALVSDRGTVASRWQYKAFGARIGAPTPETSPIAFRGAFYEPATGLSLLHGRWYSPAHGSFLQPKSTIDGRAYAYTDHFPRHISPRPTTGLSSFAALARDASLSASVSPRSQQRSSQPIAMASRGDDRSDNSAADFQPAAAVQAALGLPQN